MEEIKAKKLWLHAGVVLFFMLIFPLFPPFASLTPLGMKALGVFIGCIYGWSVGQIMWVSLAALIVLGLSKGYSVNGMLASAYGNSTVLMVLFSLVFCYGVQKSGLLDYIAKWILTRKFAQKGPWNLFMAFLIAAAVSGALITTPLPSTILLWSIFYSICSDLNFAKRSRYVTISMVGMVVAGYAGAALFPYSPMTQLQLGLLLQIDPTLEVNYMAYILTVLLFNVFLIAAMVVFVKYVLRIKVDYKVPETLTNMQREPMTRSQKWVLMYLILACFMMVAPGFLPVSGLKVFLNNLGVTGCFIVISIAMTLTVCEGKSLTNITEALSKGVTFDLVFLVATALAMSNILTAPESGVSILLAEILDPLFAGMSPILLIAIMVVVGTVLTNCLNSIVCASLLIPIGYTYLHAVGGNIMLMHCLLSVAILQGVVMPAGSAMGALLHGNTEWLSSGGIYKHATLQEILLIVVLLIVGVGFGNWIFG